MTKSNYIDYESKLGANAKLGVSYYLLDRNGVILKQDEYNHTAQMPMASTFKVPIALAVLKRIYEDKKLNLHKMLKISKSDLSAGLQINSLDQYYFSNTNTKLDVSIDELLTLMLTESDNTATDKLLELIGGPDAANDLMRDLGIEGYNLKRSCHQLLSDYYNIPSNKSPSNTKKMINELQNIFQMRPSEAMMFESNQDTCMPKTMSDLLKLMVTQEVTHEQTWLAKSSKWICHKMQQCQTGSNLIKKAVSAHSVHVQQFGHKTGGLGGIRNDTGFIRLRNGYTIILSIYTCHSPLELDAREVLIAKVANEILDQSVEETKD